ncbi:MAG TPA: gamma-glutamyl kinase, partial [Paracoccus sp. (in: a-proteobacteria)]|nr:gamma-glutamyl kinase [Paracoccus sp. (in: a-proteobacteria)]
MLAFVRARLVLFSVPKTGTTALESALAGRAELILRSRPEIKHLNLRQYHAHVAPILRMIPGQRFETVAVIRDPVDWLGSWYRYRSRADLVGRPNSTAHVSFDRFVEDY